MAKTNEIIGRTREQDMLERCINSNKPELIAVYGRRRVGKTFLIKQYFHDDFDFYISGIYGVSNAEQLERFAYQLSTFAKKYTQKPKNWFEAFDMLKAYLTECNKQKIIIFIDELPWFDTPKSSFIRALESFWNMWASTQNGIKMIVCGSSTTWIINKLLGDKGGLHNRVTCRIYLKPFTLAETEQFVKKRKIKWNRALILQCYMALGGIPYYWEMLDSQQSPLQNIDRLFFEDNAALRMEYDFMMRSLFNDSVSYQRVIATLSKKMKGMTRQEILNALKINDNGTITTILENLCNCDIIRKYSSYGKRQRDVMYQLTDMYSLFYLRFVKDNNTQNPHFFADMKDQQRSTWYGYAFEQVCLRHVEQLKHAIGISGVSCNVCSWSKRADEDTSGTQIDLLIERADGIINICEMKYSDKKYELTSAYRKTLEERISIFREATDTDSTVQLTMVTTHGLKENKNSFIIDSQVKIDDLFWEQN